MFFQTLCEHIIAHATCLSFTHFLITLCLHLDIPHLKVPYLSRCLCGHTINDLDIHLLCCPCGKERTTTHDIPLQPLHQRMELTYKQRFPTFSHAIHKQSEYCQHQRWFSNLSGCCDCRSNLYKFGVACFNNNNACNNSCHSKQGVILHRMGARRRIHSPCHKTYDCLCPCIDSFFDFLCTCQYSSSLVNVLSTFDAYILLQATSVNNLPTCVSQCDSLVSCYT